MILFGNDIKNISIAGNGIIDGRGTVYDSDTIFLQLNERRFTRQKEEYQG